MSRYCIPAFLLLALSTLFAEETNVQGKKQTREGEKIRIAIMDLTPKARVTMEETQQVSEILRTQLIQKPVFDVVERGTNLSMLTEEAIMQMSEQVESDDSYAVQMGKLLAVNQIMIGTMGKLYNKIVVTVRLVNVQSGRIIFAHNMFSDETNFIADLNALAVDIADRALTMLKDVTLDEIREKMQHGDYEAANNDLMIYTQNKGVTQDVIEIEQEIKRKLAQTYFDNARSMLRVHNYKDAKDYINKAIALGKNKEYYEFRDKVAREEREYLRRKREEEERMRMQAEMKRREHELKMKGAEMMEPWWKKPVDYFKNLSLTGWHFGISYNTGIDSRLDILALDPLIDTDDILDWGIEFFTVGAFFQENAGKNRANFIGYMGLNITYTIRESAYVLHIAPYVSPWIFAWGMKIGNVTISLGFDGGASFLLGTFINEGYLIGVTGGALLDLQVKLYESFGVFVAAKADYVYYPDKNDFSTPALRFSAGLVF